jgi:hypothetical protein
MNDRFIGCDRCKVYVDAGYRWAYWQLEEPGVVKLDQPIDLVALESAKEYWIPGPDEANDWLCRQILPSVRCFITDHGGHGLRYIDSDMVYDPEGPYSDWTESTPSA